MGILFFDYLLLFESASTNQLYQVLNFVLFQPRGFEMSILGFMFWLKIRTSYLIKSWIYTTNHKRISMNYFSFIFVSGTAGMSLATIVRLEFAYPGVGVLAGDSLQYLSIATAHGVIMVFFMIMPTLFGAFGNFLLPTQLGVHDVAFPRLNSAAFWFLPGGLIMLAQLVCIDRRYQRMNCFNIRELQSMLKRKYFTDLVESMDYRELFGDSVIILRYRTHNTNAFDTNSNIFHHWGITHKSKNRSLILDGFNLKTLTDYRLLDFSFSFKDTAFYTYVVNTTDWLHVIYSVGLTTFKDFNITSFSDILTSFKYLYDTLYLNLPITSFIHLHMYAPSWFKLSVDDVIIPNPYTFTTSKIVNKTSTEGLLLNESGDTLRFTRFHNPIISYSYKTGHYIGIWDKLYPSLMTMFIEAAKNTIKASWIFSPDFIALLATNHKTFVSTNLDKSLLDVGL